MPRNQSEGEIPHIAITTGAGDALECLMHQIGIDDAEVSTSAGAGAIHLYQGNGTSMAGGVIAESASTLWNSLDNLKAYDQVIMSCEASQEAKTKSQAAMDNVKTYADLGGFDTAPLVIDESSAPTSTSRSARRRSQETPIRTTAPLRA
ncbi:MAG: hypothetical protein AB7O24_33010 [Kofleriaceae bacterium]